MTTKTTLTFAAVVLGLGAVALAGCYNPKIPEGVLKCGGAGKDECPEDYKCLGGLCYKDGSAGGGAGASGGAGGGMSGQGGAAGAMMCVAEFFSSCRAGAATGRCDPVCQSGCGCAERCSPNDKAQMVCAPYARTQNLEPYADCTGGLPADLCRPGSVCLAERAGRPECGAHCYRFCRQDSECETARGNGRCVGIFQVDMQEGTTRTCSPPLETCNPVGAVAANSSCREKYGENFACYLLSTSIPDQVICDCKGTLNEGETCGGEHECRPGLECFALPNTGMACRPVCHLRPTGALTSGCDPGFTCEPFLTAGNVPSTKIGYCKKLL